VRRKLSKSEIAKRSRMGAYHDGSKPLTAKKINQLKAAGRYHDATIPGLYLQVTEGKGAPAKSWILRYSINSGPERTYGLGSLKIVTLADARSRARAVRLQLLDGIDPLVQKRQVKEIALRAAAKALTFREASQRYFKAHESKWTPKHASQYFRSLEKFAFPVIGNMDVANISVEDVLRVVQPIWHSKTETAVRALNRIESVLDWAAVLKHREGDNPARWDGHLEQVLPSRGEIAPGENFPAMPYKELPAFMTKLRQQQGVAARALEFLILCASRSAEVFGAPWSEIKWEEGIWEIPKERMKPGKEHRVPLSPAALDLLRALPREENNTFIFIGEPGRNISAMGMPRLLRRMGYDGEVATVHGFRSSFRDWAAEETNFARDVVEKAIAHSIGNKTQEAYQRGALLEKRRKLMAAWARYVASPPMVQTKKVVSIQGRQR
jgi:integrase